MNDFRADLHAHSIFSDGTFSPEKLIDLALERNLQGLSITDHDTIASYPTALAYAREKKFPLLTGVEFSAHYRNSSIHILGYAFNEKDEEILNLCKLHQQRREKRNDAMLEKLKKLGIRVDKSDIQPLVKDGVVGRPHIAIALIKKGVVATVREAFQKYLGENGRAFVDAETFSVEDTLGFIKRGKGKAIIAHPSLISKKRILKYLLDLPFDGLEGYYSLLPSDQEESYVKKGQEKGWLITGGSDFHGSIKPNIPLGCSWVGKETFDILYEHYLKNTL